MTVSFLFLFISFVFSSCTQKGAEHVVKFQIKTDKYTNDGMPFYVLAKATEYMNYVCDDSNAIFNEMTNELNVDEKLLFFYLIPGETKEIQVEGNGNKVPAIYFLFSKPGDVWSYYAFGGGKQSVKLFLGKNEIEAQSAFRK